MQLQLENQVIAFFNKQEWSQAIDLITKANPGAFNLKDIFLWESTSRCTFLSFMLFKVEALISLINEKKSKIPAGVETCTKLTNIIHALINNAVQLNPNQVTTTKKTLINDLLMLDFKCVTTLLEKISEPVQLEKITTQKSIPVKLYKEIFFASNFKKSISLDTNASKFIETISAVKKKILWVFDEFSKTKNSRHPFQSLPYDAKLKICLMFFDHECFKEIPAGHLEYYILKTSQEDYEVTSKRAQQLIPFFTTRKFFFEAGLLATADKFSQKHLTRYHKDISDLIERRLQQLTDLKRDGLKPEFLRDVKKALCTYAKNTDDLKHSEYKEVIDSTLKYVLDKWSVKKEEKEIALVAK